MSKQDNLTDFLTDVADAIREKKGTTEKINPQDFSDEIRGIDSGGNPWNADVVWAEEGTFGLVKGVKSIVVHEGVTKISDYAFRYNFGLESITLPQSLRVIGQYAFAGMDTLSEIELPNSITSIGNYAFNGTPFISMTIPPLITNLAYGLLTNCAKLKSVEILSNLSSIGGTVFQNCSALEYVIFRGSIKVPSLVGTNAFGNTTCKIVVPDALYEEWTDDTLTNWNTLKDRIVKESEYVEPTNE